MQDNRDTETSTDEVLSTRKTKNLRLLFNVYCFFTGEKRRESSTHLHLIASLRMNGGVSPLLYSLHGDNFTLSVTLIYHALIFSERSSFT